MNILGNHIRLNDPNKIFFFFSEGRTILLEKYKTCGQPSKLIKHVDITRKNNNNNNNWRIRTMGTTRQLSHAWVGLHMEASFEIRLNIS